MITPAHDNSIQWLDAHSPDDVATARAELIKLIAGYQQPDQGYASRRAMASVRYAGDYDHLARFGEWNETKTPTLMPVGT